MQDPVTAADGHTYDRSAIELWFAGHATSPLTNLPIASKVLTPNLLVKSIISNHFKMNAAP